MVFNATFNNISIISWRSVLLVEETGVHGEHHRPVASHRQTLSHNVYRVHLAMSQIRIHNYHMITIMTAHYIALSSDMTEDNNNKMKNIPIRKLGYQSIKIQIQKFFDLPLINT